MVSSDLIRLKIVDKIIGEPHTGAHCAPKEAAAAVKKEILAALEELKELPINELLKRRLEKYRVIGEFDE